jgi:hypothetical protein
VRAIVCGRRMYRGLERSPRVDAPPLPLPALRAPAPDSLRVMAPKLKEFVSPSKTKP